MYLANISIDYKNPPSGFLDRFALQDTAKLKLYKELMGQENIEAVITLQTCNRFEIYFTDKSETAGIEQAKKVLINQFGEDIKTYLSIKTYLETLKHLFRVVSSLESMIVGENQILSQCKEAYIYANEHGFTNRVLKLAFEKAINLGKKVRAETKISKGKVSISSVAVDMIDKICSLNRKKILLIGNGKMANLLAEYLKGFDITELTVVGRTPERVNNFCNVHGAQAANYKYLPEVLENVDIVFSATSAPRILIKKKVIKKIMRNRNYNPLYFVDIAVPRDIDPSASRIPNVQIYSFNDFKEISEKNMKARISEICKVEEIIEMDYKKLAKQLRNLHIEQYFASLNKYTESIRNNELEKAICMLGSVYEPKIKKVLEGFSKSLMKKLMHNFLLKIREHPLDEEELKKFTNIFMGCSDLPS